MLLAYLLMSLGSEDPCSVAFAVAVDSAVANVIAIVEAPRVPSVVVVSTFAGVRTVANMLLMAFPYHPVVSCAAADLAVVLTAAVC